MFVMSSLLAAMLMVTLLKILHKLCFGDFCSEMSRIGNQGNLEFSNSAQWCIIIEIAGPMSMIGGTRRITSDYLSRDISSTPVNTMFVPFFFTPLCGDMAQAKSRTLLNQSGTWNGWISKIGPSADITAILYDPQCWDVLTHSDQK